MTEQGGYFDDDDEVEYNSGDDDSSTSSSSSNEDEVVDAGEGEEELDDIDIDEYDNDDNDEIEYSERPTTSKKTTKHTIGGAAGTLTAAAVESDDDSDSDSDEEYLQKFNKEINQNYLLTAHPESVIHNYDEIIAMTKVVRNEDGIIVDPLHKTIPYLTKYEKARVIGQRSKQLNSGAFPFVQVPETIIDGYLIAEMELKAKRIPFIIRRPLPNGGSEYWKLSDLENISF